MPLTLSSTTSTPPVHFLFRHKRPGWVQLLAIFSCNRLGVDMSRYKTQFKCARCVHERQHEQLFIATEKKADTRWLQRDHQETTLDSENIRVAKLKSRWVLMTKSASLPGAGFWPLAGCSASQPLPKMWEARISGKSVVHPIGVCVSCHSLFP